MTFHVLNILLKLANVLNNNSTHIHIDIAQFDLLTIGYIQFPIRAKFSNPAMQKIVYSIPFH